MRNWIRYADERIGNLIIFNWVHSLAKVAAKWTDAELAEKLKKVPSKERQEAWMRAARKPYTDEERAAARGKLVGDARQDGRHDAADQMARRQRLFASPTSPSCRSSSASTRRSRPTR